MVTEVGTLMSKLPPPHGKSAGLAAVIGFLAGGIGLAIYFRNIIDLLLPLGIAIVAVAILGDPGWLAGAVLSAIYGFYRVVEAEGRSDAAGHVSMTNRATA
ncbi:MAG: hypothetical protein V9G19_16195 [Tetrasphaera sp.]